MTTPRVPTSLKLHLAQLQRDHPFRRYVAFRIGSFEANHFERAGVTQVRISIYGTTPWVIYVYDVEALNA